MALGKIISSHFELIFWQSISNRLGISICPSSHLFRQWTVWYDFCIDLKKNLSMFLWIQSKNYLAKIKSGLRIRMNFFQKYFSIWVNDEIIVSSEVAVNKKWSPRFSQLSTKGAQETICFWHAEESVWKKIQKKWRLGGPVLKRQETHRDQLEDGKPLRPPSSPPREEDGNQVLRIRGKFFKA